MAEFSTSNVGVKVGLEIHQQLETGKKLFCGCAPIESEEYPIEFQRRLRTAKSELGEDDPAALFEGSRSKLISYYGNPESSCLLEQDEEPPHGLDDDAKRIALLIASTLNSEIFSEIYAMRKTVVDGSNTSGFQRTMLISQGGSFEAGGITIGIQSICLEEDAAKNLGDAGSARKFGLERLGIPLVEIATEPFEAEPQDIKKIALALGRILRSTKKVRRGLGSIRQDVNVSIRDGGAVVEVKGVQQLEQLEKVVEYEAKRQHGLLKISKELQAREWNHDRQDITETLSECGSKIIQDAIKKGHKVVGISFRGLGGMFGYSPHEGIRLGREIAEMVRSFGIGGVFHSDELPGYGIEQGDVKGIRDLIKAGKDDGFLILACPEDKMKTIVDHIILRIKHIRDCGIPADTRLATPNGQTKFLRPRPGAARMYPETDVLPIPVSENELKEIRGEIPKSWDESIIDLQNQHGINPQLAEQIFDSKYAALFERIAKSGVSPTFVASILCSTITSLERSGLDSGLLKDEEILNTFELLKKEKIAKESVEMIFESIMSGKSDTVEGAVKAASMDVISESDLEKTIQGIVDENIELVKNQGERAVGPLMGIVMVDLRGKASGKTINDLLVKSIKKRL